MEISLNGCPLCDPEQSNQKTFECNACHGRFCPQHFLDHECVPVMQDISQVATASGGMRYEKFPGKIGSIPRTSAERNHY